ncbi:hypothetical protein Micbo1qcDRAFT_152478 [Microdochium bolleyi]|uniref:Enoyl reductase (ER) domain-containing protein n=1 Tax=Microdochium bolleyi TaxID=196109 RepID=A0A136IPU7_9PEZI|nr:hypothetical protein Micbo1qcDRAFT_152478 [Microdochium bolleyi]
MMKAVVINKFVDSYDDVIVSNVPRPVPKDDELLIQVKAAGVNFVDTLYARGKHQNNKSHVKPPFTLGLEFSGVIISVPSPSSSSTPCPFKPGDRVLGDFSGAYAEYITYPSALAAASLHHIPQTWSFAESAGLAATLPVSYGALTAAVPNGLQPGTKVLVHAAAGGLGLAAVQIAAALGCTVIGTAGSPEKCRIAERFGATACVDYTANPKWWEEILDLTGPGKPGVDVVFDSVGLVDLSLKCIAHRGKVLVVGFAGRDAGSMEGVKMNKVLLKQVSLIGYRYGESLRRYPEEKARIWDSLWPLIRSGKIKPVVYDRAYLGLESVPAALVDIASRKVWGKAVIQVDPADDGGNGEKADRSQMSRL